jgi:hypothetical protein
MMTTNQKGAIAETAVIHLAAKHFVPVWRPVFEGGRSDLILGLSTGLVRVQCKWAPLRDDVVSVPFYSSRRVRGGFRRSLYSADDVDAFAAYCVELNRCFYIPFDRVEGRSGIELRVSPPRNGQRRGIHWADRYDFEATLRASSLGP